MARYQHRTGVLLKVKVEVLKTSSMAALFRGSICQYRQSMKYSMPQLAILDWFDKLAAPLPLTDLIDRLATCNDQTIEGSINMLALLREWRNKGNGHELDRLYALDINELIDIQTDKIIAACSVQNAQPSNNDAMVAQFQTTWGALFDKSYFDKLTLFALLMKDSLTTPNP